jgi:multiple sugar transport system permease protein
MSATVQEQKAPRTVDGPPARRRRGLRLHHPLTPYALCAPYVILLLTFVVGPAIFGVWISLHDWDFLLPEKPFIGVQNYLDLFDPESVISENFWIGMQNTAIFTVASVPFLVVVPLGVALLLNRRFPARTFFRAMIFAPFVLGIAVIGVLFNYLLETDFGLINAVFELFHGLFDLILPLGPFEPIGWTQTQPWAWVALVGMTVWWTLGFNTVIYLAGIQNIPAEQYEAAEIDGAGGWGKLIHITLPGLRMVMIFIVTTTILASANMFGQSYLVTNGGPGDSTRTAIMVMTEEGLRGFKMGTASAMSYVLALCLAIISIINFLAMRERKS